MKLAILGTCAIVAGLAACGGPDEVLPPAVIDAAVDAATVDAPTDGPPADADVRCAACTASQVCVQSFSGTCGELRLECQNRNAACATGVGCTPECNLHHCRASGDGGLLTCETAGCPGANPNALHCYGP